MNARAWRNGRRARLRIWCRKAYEFKSLRPHTFPCLSPWLDAGYAVVAQLVERHLAKVEVAGPSPVYRSIYTWCHSQVVRQRSAKPSFPGSNPGGTSLKDRLMMPVFLFTCFLPRHAVGIDFPAYDKDHQSINIPTLRGIVPEGGDVCCHGLFAWISFPASQRPPHHGCQWRTGSPFL